MSTMEPSEKRRRRRFTEAFEVGAVRHVLDEAHYRENRRELCGGTRTGC